MSETETAAPDAGEQVIIDKSAQTPNGTVRAGVKVTRTKQPAQPAAAAAPAEEPCDDCAEPDDSGSRALGMLILGVAGFLLYIGLDLASRGALSRKLGGRPPEEEQPQ